MSRYINKASPYVKNSSTTVDRRRLNQHKTITSPQNNPFISYLENLTPAGRKSMYSILSTACSYIGWDKKPENYPWETIVFRDILAIKLGMLNDQYAVNSVNMALCGLRSIARMSFLLGHIDSNELGKIRSIKAAKGSPSKKGRCLSRAEIKAVIAANNTSQPKIKMARNKAIFLTGCTAGLRADELINLKIQDYESKKGLLRVTKCKGGKQREVYVCQTTRTAIEAWIRQIQEDNGPLFRAIDKHGNIGSKMISASGLGKVIKDLYINSGIESISPHDLRRTFITRLLEQNRDINTVRKLAGHTSITTTAIYDFRDEKHLMKSSRSIKI